jgi:hypothetical protein
MVCDQCNGSGKIVCKNCEGKGYYMDRMDYTYYVCLACGGEGTTSFYTIPSLLKAVNKKEVKLGSGWIICNKCQGKGLIDNDYEFLISIIRKLMNNEKLTSEEIQTLKEKYKI